MSLFLQSSKRPVLERFRYALGRPQSRRNRGLKALGCAIACLAGLSGCAAYDQRPEINPDLAAPAKVAREWAPPSQAVTFDLASELGEAQQAPPESGKRYSLPALVDLALEPESGDPPHLGSGACGGRRVRQGPGPLLSIPQR